MRKIDSAPPTSTSEVPSFVASRAGDASDFTNIIQNVCSIFHEVTGVPSDAKREGAAIVHWVRKGWQIYDFRLVFEYLFRNEKCFQYFSENPGRLNIRGFLNISGERETMLIDLHSALKNQANIDRAREKSSPAPSSGCMMLMRCGTKLLVGDPRSYNNHLSICFGRKGGCFS